ncbi:MAG: hypothetical protein IKK36_03655 [Bacteroidales bacterium]|nr:hypothetical protein [Bacteroidales bacterium]
MPRARREPVVEERRHLVPTIRISYDTCSVSLYSKLIGSYSSIGLGCVKFIKSGIMSF